MRAVIVDVSTDLLRLALALPANCEIVGTNTDASNPSVRLIVKSPEFEDVPPDQPLPHASPVVSKVAVCYETRFVEWGIQC